MIKFCKKCYEEHRTNFPSGYSYLWKDEVKYCPLNECGGELIDIDFPAKDLSVLIDISETKPFIDAMINLYQKDIIEYELKMSQFRSQVEQQKQVQSDNKLHCPYCNSTNVKKISLTSKAVHVGVLGFLAAGKVVKQYHCNSCKSDF